MFMRFLGFVFLAFPPLASAGAADRGSGSAVDEVATILNSATLVANGAACDIDCSYFCISSTDHRTWTDDHGDFFGARHGCIDTMLGCGYHDCQPFAHGDLDRLEELLPRLDPTDLVTLTSTAHSRLLINHERRALQVVGCGDAIVLSLPASEQQAGLFGLTTSSE